ncbi:MAG TPA: hypothetical protein VNY35_02940 [Solirubrobacteraceae bacterium]|jgi:hypothetical protein|nr:hypothetical protein [Solirubrobacteraceae bacterium]
MSSRASDVMQGYATLASSLLGRWGAHASEVASKVDAPEYDAARAVEDVTACASLATEGGLLLAAEALEAFATLAGVACEGNIETSQRFHAPAGAALTLTGPLVKGPGLASIPASAITIKPSQLAPTDTEFTLLVDTTGRRGATYYGTVEASTAAGTPPVTIWVWVTIP